MLSIARLHLPGENGISMIEILVAMLVLSIGILAMAPMMALSITGNRFGDEVTSIAAAAQRRIEDKVAHGKYTSLPLETVEYANDGAFRVTTQVIDQTSDSSVPDNVVQITVTVDWTDDTGMARNLSFITYASKV